MIGVLDFNVFAIGGDIEVLYDFKDDAEVQNPF